MWRDRKKLLRGVVAFLVGCAALGFLMGIKGALPRGGAREAPTGPPAAPSGEVVIEAAPIDEAIATPPAEEEKADDEKADEEEKAEKAKEPEKKAEPEAPKIVAPPPPAPKEEPPPADPVGDLIPAPPPDAVLY